MTGNIWNFSVFFLIRNFVNINLIIMLTKKKNNPYRSFIGSCDLYTGHTIHFTHICIHKYSILCLTLG